MDTQELQKIKNRFEVIGNDAALNRALETAVAVARTDLTVLITGESGAGKEVVPKIIHQYSRRKNGKYLAVNCGAIPEGTINAELFGHEKGAFTGAVGDRKGYFEEADGGTLFLDEIGELPKETQAMLLRVLQSGEFMKVGSSVTQKTDVRIVAATNVDLREAVRRGRFREDLYYRLNAIQIVMPSLRERKDDIYLLFRKFTSDFSEKYGVCKVSLSHDAISLLKKYRWPGNVRQLKNIAETISALESKPIVPGSDSVVLDAPALATYLPDEKDSLLPAFPGNSSGMNEESTQMIIRALFDLKSQVDALQEQVDLMRNVHQLAAPAKESRSDEPEWKKDIHPAPQEGTEEEAEWQEQEQQAEQQEESLSLKKNNEDLIGKALEKHGGKVKLAAAELGISERTIYRKLAEKKTRQ